MSDCTDRPPVAMISGGSLLAWSAGVLWLLSLQLISTIGFLIAIPLSQLDHLTFIRILTACEVIGGLSVVALFISAVQDSREIHAGYTTVLGWHRNLDQVDPKTGRIVRAAGQPLISHRQLMDMRAQVDMRAQTKS